MNISYKLLDPHVPAPTYALVGDAGFDLYARETISIAPMEYKAIPSGLALEIPLGYAGLIWDKSGLSIKNGLKVLGGVIDSGYRGEILIGVINLGSQEYVFEKGKKVAQMLIQKVESIDFVSTTELSETERGDNGFGSTGI